ncbi:MAG TPA: glycosyltransferase family 2 protein [Thermoanaerobaculaceae bacterium]|nr:glycosyltransferase family 2 protein [Thermoanaerobaculaceae bacterium]
MSAFPRLGELLPPEQGPTSWTHANPPTRPTAPGGPAWPSMTVITPSLNQGILIRETIASVAGQRYPGLEHLVVDGGSTDGTLDVLRACAGSVRWVSEADAGQADAINKGLDRTAGEIVAWLNADDLWAPGAAAAAAGFLAAHPEVDVVYGDCIYLFQDVPPEEARLVRARPFDLDTLLNVGCYVPQPATFLRRAAIEGVRLDTGLRFALDYDLWIRLARAGRTFAYLPQTLAAFRVTCDSKSGRLLDEFWREVREVSLRNGGRAFSPMLLAHFKERAARRWPRAWGVLKRLARRAPRGA